MRPIFTTVGDQIDLIIIPHTKVELDGHPVLTQDYHIYKDRFGGSGKYLDNTAASNTEKEKDPDYMGVVTLELPDEVFKYQPNGQSALSAVVVQEVLDIINYYRERPELWVIG